MKKVVIFDFDGVIVDSCQVSYGINIEVAPDLKYSEWQSWFEGNVFETVREDLAKKSVRDAFYEKYNSRLLGVLPVAGIKNVLKSLAQDYILTIVSSSSNIAVTSYLKKHNLNSYFADTLTMEVHASKVEKFKMIIKKYDITPNEALMITDTLGDIKEANQVGIKSIAVSWGVHDREKLAVGLPSFTIDEPGEIVGVVKSILV